MAIHYTCPCGQPLHAPDGAALRPARCPACGVVTPVPATSTTPAHPRTQRATPEAVPDAPDAGAGDGFERGGFGGARGGARRFAPPKIAPGTKRTAIPGAPSAGATGKAAGNVGFAPPRPPGPWRAPFFVVVLLALVPLVVWPFRPDVTKTMAARALATFTAHADQPGVADARNAAAEAWANDPAFTPFDYLQYLPNHKIDGALFGHDDFGHILLAIFCAGVLIPALLPAMYALGRGTVYTVLVLVAALCTGAGFILMAAGLAQDAPPRFADADGLFDLLGTWVSWSYTAAFDRATSPFGAGVLFATCVGLALTFAKALPLLVAMKWADKAATRARLVALAIPLGLGLGLAEAMVYAGEYYNGVEGTDAYLMHFVSVPVLSAVWAAAIATMLFDWRDRLADAPSNWVYTLYLFVIVLVPLTLHAAFDTLLKREARFAALLIALASVGWLAGQVYRKTEEA